MLCDIRPLSSKIWLYSLIMKIKSHLEKLYVLIQEYNSVPVPDLYKDTYSTVLKAVLAKSLDFNLFLYRNRSPKNSFFYSPFLRGLCEDLITMKFLKKHFSTDTNTVIFEYMLYLMFGSINAQTMFLKKNAPLQPSVAYKEIEGMIAEKEDALKKLMEKNGLNKNKIFPSVEHMAIDSKLKSLYDFLYHATSRMVHFSPNVLLRMGWYEKDGPTVFSSDNFHSYYESFNKFYAPYLLVKLCQSFKKELNLKPDFMKEIKSIEAKFTPYVFYPELITYEEMNFKRPKDGTFERILSEMATLPDGDKMISSLESDLKENENSDLSKEQKTIAWIKSTFSTK